MQVFNKLADQQRPLVVAKGDRVDGQTSLPFERGIVKGVNRQAHQLLDEADQRVQVLLDSEVEAVPVL